jgi:glycosyltransferase involved in cell wall biosynthesis
MAQGCNSKNCTRFVKITVITVTFNSAATIADTLNSVARQTYADVEHWVIDGASTDGTLEVVRAHASSAVRVLSEPDAGMYDAMNKGIKLATGDVVGFLNADDYFADTSVLERIANAMRLDTVDACFGDLMYVTALTGKPLRYWKSRDFRVGDFSRGWCPAHPTFYVRKSVFSQWGDFDLSYRLGSDVELMMRFLERGKICSIYIPHTLVRMRAGGVSNQSWKNIVVQNQEILKALRNNSVAYSAALFWIFKISRRIVQRISGRLKREP